MGRSSVAVATIPSSSALKPSAERYLQPYRRGRFPLNVFSRPIIPLASVTNGLSDGRIRRRTSFGTGGIKSALFGADIFGPMRTLGGLCVAAICQAQRGVTLNGYAINAAGAE